MTDAEPIAPEHIAHVIALLERAHTLADDALVHRGARGEPNLAATPPARAVRVTSATIEGVRNGTMTPTLQNLGLGRGADDHTWLPEEEPLVDLLYEVDRYWYEHIWDRKPSASAWKWLKVRHVDPNRNILPDRPDRHFEP